jgi:hypothetical protein
MPEVRSVMSLKYKGNFLMHGVVLQNRVFRAPARETAPMFHVKHSCVKKDCRPRRTAGDVSRETFLRKNGLRKKRRHRL